MGRFWAVLGSSWAALSRLWDLLGRSWAPLGQSGPPLGRILGHRTPPGLHFKAFWRLPGSRFPMVFAAPALCYLMLFFDAVTIIFAFTVTIFLLFWCGGLCAAHGI